MPFPIKIQPIDTQTYGESIRDDVVKPVLKSRLKRLFDRQFPSVLRISTAEKPSGGEPQYCKDGATEFEPSSVCLAKMVQNFMEESNEKQSAAKCGRNRCNCFNGKYNDSSDDEFDLSCFGDSIRTSSFGDSLDSLKSLIPCASVSERNLLADTSNIVEKNKIFKLKDDLRNIVTESLLLLGYDASICKSRWEKSPSHPAGEYEYIDVIVEGERLLIDIDFRSEFEIARSTGNYKTILQSLPYIFVGKDDRLQQIVAIVSEAAKQSLKKKGMHIPPWRKADYMIGKWLSPHIRMTPPPNDAVAVTENKQCSVASESDFGETELFTGEKMSSSETDCENMIGKWLSTHVRMTPPPNDAVAVTENKQCSVASTELFTGEKMSLSSSVMSFGVGEKSAAVLTTWQPPAIKPKSCQRGTKVVVTGLASLFKEKQ